MKNSWRRLAIVGISVAILSACSSSDNDPVEEEEVGASPNAPERPYTDFFAPIPNTALYPADAPHNAEQERLGEFLFWDPILSGDMNVSCASCHHPQFAWADGIERSIGVDGVGLGPDRVGDLKTGVHAPTVLNVGFTGLVSDEVPHNFVSGGYFWDLRAETLEQQAIGPIKNNVEMRGERFSEDEILPEIIDRLSGIDEYRTLFANAFGDPDAITEDNIATAIAMFQRKIITPRTRFDEFLEGDTSALSEQETIGLNKFINGGCADCHNGPLLSNFEIEEDQPVLREFDAVRTPSLRNIELTAPYMHTGTHRTLAAAVEEYEGREDLEVTLENEDINDILAFLGTLTTEDFYQDIPSYVPSSFPVGGDI